MTEPVTSPRRNISTVTFSELAQRESGLSMPVLLDIEHPEIVWNNETDLNLQDGHLRVVNDTIGLKYKGDDDRPYWYFPCVFKLKLPKEDGKKSSTASLTISCLDSGVIDVIRSVEEDLTCRVVALYAKMDDTGKYIFSKQYGKRFSLGSVTWSGTNATWELDPNKVMSAGFPRDTASQFRFPGAVGES